MININEVVGHMVEAEISVKGMVGKSTQTVTGRIIYSGYNASLFFKPKGNKNKGYLIESEEDIQSVNVIRKDNKNNAYYMEAYANREHFEQQFNKRIEEEAIARKEQDRLRQERFQLEREKKKERDQKHINEAKKLGGYEELENDVINYYKSFEGEFFNENFVKTIVVPIINKLIHKSVNNVNGYPKHYFDKKRNKKFCTMIENKVGVKLPNTQKGSVNALNDYLTA